MKIFYISTVLALVFISAFKAEAQECTKSESNWRGEATTYLTKNGEYVTAKDLASHKYLRCIKMNNYVCMMHSSPNNPWKGAKGRHDCALGENGHAVFTDAKYSIRAMVRDLCSKHKRGIRSALQIVEVRTPWCDTNGSKAERNGYARTCNSGPRLSDQEIEQRNLVRCEKPTDGKLPSQKYCNSCNCPDIKKADRFVAGLDVYGIKAGSSPLGLFDNEGQINVEIMSLYLSNVVADEIGGLRPNKKLFEEAFAISGSCS